MTTESSEILEFLRNNKLFTGFTETQLLLIVPLVHEVKLATGQFIIHENDVCDYFYLIKSGTIEICCFDKEIGQYHSLATLKEGEIVGEIAILDRQFRSASARAVEPSILYEFSIDKLKAISGSEKPDATNSNLFSLFTYNLAQLIGRKLRDTNEITLTSLRKELKHNKEKFYFSLIALSILILICIFIFFF